MSGREGSLPEGLSEADLPVRDALSCLSPLNAHSFADPGLQGVLTAWGLCFGEVESPGRLAVQNEKQPFRERGPWLPEAAIPGQGGWVGLGLCV